jgi:hypothetical protein
MPVTHCHRTLSKTPAPRLKKWATRVLVVFAVCGGLGRTQDQPPGKGKGCTNSTVDPTRLCPVICCPMPKRITDDNAV